MAEVLSINYLELVRRNALYQRVIQSYLALRAIKALDPDKAAYHAKRAIHYAMEFSATDERIKITVSVQKTWQES